MTTATTATFTSVFRVRNQATKQLKELNGSIREAVTNMKNVDKEFTNLDDATRQSMKKMQDSIGKTKGKGAVWATYFGTLDKTPPLEGMKKSEKFMGELTDLLGDDLVDAIGDVLLKMKSLKTLTTAAFLTVFTHAVGKALELLEKIQDIRGVMKLTTSQARDLGTSMIQSLLKTGAGLETVSSVYKTIAEQGLIGTKQVKEMAEASIIMSEAWGMAGEEVQELNRLVADMYGAGRKGILKTASAMDHVARSTALTKAQISDLIKSLQPLMNRIPRELRQRVGPQMMADITAIAGAFSDMFGDPGTITEQMQAMLDPFNEAGNKMKSMIVGFGRGTMEGLEAALKEGRVADVFEQQITAIQNMKKEMGDDQFRRSMTDLAEAWGMSADDLSRMSEMSIEATKQLIADTRKAAQSQEGIRESWQTSMGTFTKLWNRIENLGEAIFFAIGKPLLDILIKVLEPLQAGLEWILDWMSQLSEGEMYVLGLGAAFGALGSAAIILLPLLSAIGGLIAGVIIPAALEMAPALAILAIIGASIALVWYSIKKNWEMFYDMIKPELADLRQAWSGLTQDVTTVWAEFKKAFGDGPGGIADILGVVTQIVAWLAAVAIKGLLMQLTAVIKVVRPLIKFAWELAKPFVELADFLLGNHQMTLFDELSEIGKRIQKVLIAPLTALSETWKFLFGSYLSDTLASWWTSFKATIASGVDWVKKQFSDFGTWISTFFTGLGATIMSALGLKDALKGELSGALGVIMNALKTPIDYMKGFINDWIIKPFNEQLLMWDPPGPGGTIAEITGMKQIPMMAEGGLVDTPSIFGEAGPEVAIPLDRFSETVEKTVNVDMDPVVAAIQHMEATLVRIANRGSQSIYTSGAV